MSSLVNVEGIDRKVLLRKLWENAKPASFFTLQDIPSPAFSLEIALGQLQSNGVYADYICGRCIKTNVFAKEDTIDGRLYDREYGQGSFQKVVNQCKKQ